MANGCWRIIYEANLPLIHHTVEAVLIAVAHELAAKVLVPVPAVPSPRFSVSEVMAIESVPLVLIKLIIVPVGYATLALLSIVTVNVPVVTMVPPASPRTVV